MQGRAAQGDCEYQRWQPGPRHRYREGAARRRQSRAFGETILGANCWSARAQSGHLYHRELNG
jgi:hypothetical protein